MKTGRSVNIPVATIGDLQVRLAVENIRRHLQEAVFANFDGDFYTYTFSANGTYVLPHGMKFQPHDVLQTSVVGGTVVWNYGSFSDTNISLTVSGISGSVSCTVRAFIGSYGGQT